MNTKEDLETDQRLHNSLAHLQQTIPIYHAQQSHRKIKFMNELDVLL